jgi:hypothetical protein
MAAGFFCGMARAATWTWTGLGSDDNWSTTNNWRPCGIPASDDATILFFDGTARLVPQQDCYAKCYFGGLVFTNTAGSFQLGGVTNVASLSGFRTWQFSGSFAPFIKVLTTNAVSISGALIAMNGTASAPKTSLVEVASGGLLQVPQICGGLGDVVTKRGDGTLRVCEPADGLRYAITDIDAAPEYRIEAGTVEMGIRTGRCVFGDSQGTNWIASAAHGKCYNTLVVGDGLGCATSSVLRLIGPAAGVIDPDAAVFVNADGLLDFHGVQDWDPAGSPCLSVSNGLVRMGGCSLFVRSGKTLDLRGAARVEGDGTNALMLFDGATNTVDAAGTRAVLAADAALVKATGAAGVVFQVAARTGDVVALDITGHLGAGGAGSHLVKRGAGTMAIADLTHAVRTNRVEEGTLLINGLSRCAASSGAAQWVVLTNATLGGVGTVSNAAVVVQGGTIDPGDAAAGTLTIDSNLVLAAGASLVFDLTCGNSGSGVTNDQLVLRSGVVTGLSCAALRIEVSSSMDVDGQCFRIISGGGNLSGQSFREVSLIGCRGRRADTMIGNGYVDVTIRNPGAGTGLIVR